MMIAIRALGALSGTEWTIMLAELIAAAAVAVVVILWSVAVVGHFP